MSLHAFRTSRRWFPRSILSTALPGALAPALLAAASLGAQCSTPWSPGGDPGDTTGAVRALALDATGAVVAGGNFTQIEEVAVQRLARWNGTTWQQLGSGVNFNVFAVAKLANDDLLVGGANVFLRRWDGTSWSNFGTVLNNSVWTIAAHPNGDVFAGGLFTTAGGAPANRIARWDGSSWHPLGSGLPSSPEALAVLPTGDLIVGGQFTIATGAPANYLARWDGTAWHPFGAGVNGQVFDLVVDPDGHLIVGGVFSSIGGTPANRIARWDGTTWHAYGSGLNGLVTSVALLPAGDLVVAGTFTQAGGSPAERIARWNGASWAPLGSGLTGGVPESLLFDPAGTLWAGGSFTQAGGLPSVNLARAATTCPPLAANFGSGCPSSGGSNTLSVLSPAYADAVFRATGTGLPPVAIVIAATSVTSIPQGLAPLAALLPPQGQPGCDLLVQPDILQAMVTLTGSAESELFLPNVPPIVGVTFFHQMVPIELDGLGNWVAITSTNALQVTAGLF